MIYAVLVASAAVVLILLGSPMLAVALVLLVVSAELLQRWAEARRAIRISDEDREE